MRRRIQQVCGKLVGPHGDIAAGWLVALAGTLVYLLTMDRSVSWWDCGEFIATGYGLQVGHPPGAPLYQLVTHCVMLLSFGNPLLVAPLSNAVSAVCGGLTAMLLYWTIRLLQPEGEYRRRYTAGALVGAACYLFCDTAWFSAVESEVYSMAMLFCALTVWLMLRWERRGDGRRLLLVALLLGLGVCVHLMTLLTTPMLLWVFVRRMRRRAQGGERRAGWRGWCRLLLFGLFFFLLGLTPYAIVPLRAAAHPPINEGHPESLEAFGKYLSRDQYPQAPLYPRMWRERDAEHWKDWTLGADGVLGNVVYCGGYQLGYMYFRYLMYNYIGRENLKWKIIVVSGLPLLLGLWGMWKQRKRRRGDFHAVGLLFLFGGIILNLYLNHPCYEPRERDYAYVLSFYAFAVWIGLGAGSISHRWLRWVALLAPLTLAVGNWSDHDRHNCHSVHDISLNHLQSCDHGAILISQGDNDTFPLWYLKYVEGRRPDIDLYNINLTGYQKTYDIIRRNYGLRPIYFTQYTYDKLAQYYPGRLRCEGFCWKLVLPGEAVDDRRPLQRHIADSIRWNITDNEYKDRITRSFLRIWEENTSTQ